MGRVDNFLTLVIAGDFAPSVPSSGVPSAPNEESAESRAGCDTLCEKLEATRKELTQMSKVREANFRLSTVSMVDSSKRDLHDFGDRMNQIDVIEESETTGQTSGIPSPDSQTFKPTTKTVATDTDDLATWTGDVPTLTEPVTAAVDVDVENLEGKGEEVKEVKEVTSEVTQGDQVEEVECQGTQAEGVEGQTQRKKCEIPEIPEIPEGPGSARQPGPKIRTAPEGSQSRSTSVRVQITNRSNPRLRPNSRSPKESKDSKESKESKEQKERSASRPRMATQLHVPVSARLSSRRAKVEVSGLEKSFSARELSRYLAHQKAFFHVFFLKFFSNKKWYSISSSINPYRKLSNTSIFLWENTCSCVKTTPHQDRNRDKRVSWRLRMLLALWHLQR